MILDGILNFFMNLVTRLVDAIPKVPNPVMDWLDTAVGAVEWLIDKISVAGSVLPLNTIGACIGIIIVMWVAIFAIRLGMKLVSHFTGGGGSID